MKRQILGLTTLLAAGLFGTVTLPTFAQTTGGDTNDSSAGKRGNTSPTPPKDGQTTSGSKTQTDPNHNRNKNGSGAGTTTGNAAGTGTAAKGAQTTGAASGMLTTAEFNLTQTVANMNMAEYRAAQMALEQGVSESTLQYARRVQDDHDVNSARLQAFFDARKLLPPRQMDAKSAEQLNILSKYNNRNFDGAYKKFTVSSHNQMVTLLRNEIKTGRDADLKTYAESTLAMVQSHLKLAHAINPNGKAAAGPRTTQTPRSNRS